MVRAVDEGLVDDQAVLVIAMLVGVLEEALGVGANRAAAFTLEPAQQPYPFIMMAGLRDPASNAGNGLELVVEILTQHARPGQEEMPGKKLEHRLGPHKIPPLPGTRPQGEQALEEVHMRVLPPWRISRRIAFEVA